MALFQGTRLVLLLRNYAVCVYGFVESLYLWQLGHVMVLDIIPRRVEGLHIF